MANYLFPFASVRQGAKVIIYGCGDMGCQFLAQLAQSNYAKVVACVDRAAAELQFLSVPVKTMADVDWKGNWYDYVVIAIQDRKISAAVFASLMNYGAPQRKIVLSSGNLLRTGLVSKEQMSNVFSHEASLKNVLSAYCNSKYKSLDLLFDMCEWLREHDTVSLREQLKAWLRKTEYLCADEQAALLQQVYLAGMFDADFVKIMLSVIPKVSCWQDGYAMLMDISFVDANLDNHIDWRYPKFYQDMRLAIRGVFDKANLYMKHNVGTKDRKIKRVAFLMTFIHSVRYALGALLPLMNQLAGNGIQVSFFSLGTSFYDENELPKFIWQPMSKRYDMSSHGGDAQGYAVYLDEKGYYHSSIEVHDSYKMPIAVKLQEYLDRIDAFNPNAIILFSDDRMLISYIISKYYPVVQIPTKRLVSAMFFHTFLTNASKEQCLYANKAFCSIDEDRICTCPGDGIPFMGYLDQRKYDRQTFGLEKNDFVVVTVGLRLEQELTEDLILSMAKLIERNAHIKWLLVYRNEPHQVYEYENLVRTGRIVMRGWEENLPALYDICDACLNPDREGGGVSLRLAMQAGLPVVSADVPPLEGFFLPENFVVGGSEEMIAELEKLSTDDGYYRGKSDLMKKLMLQCRQGGAEKFWAILQETHDKFYAGGFSEF